MIYITGDQHGRVKEIFEFTERFHTSKEDILIILGDAGFNYWEDSRDDRVKAFLQKLPITLFCIHGNHEKRPYDIPSYHTTEFCGGTAYVEDEYPNIFFAIDGEVYRFNDLDCMAIGGAYSVDKFFRITMGYKWFSNEQPGWDIKKWIEEQLENRNHKIDVILSHTCPSSVEPVEMYLPQISQNMVDKSTEEWLQKIESKTDYTKWYCGHWHTDKTDGKFRFMYHDFEEFIQ